MDNLELIGIIIICFTTTFLVSYTIGIALYSGGDHKRRLKFLEKERNNARKKMYANLTEKHDGDKEKQKEDDKKMALQNKIVETFGLKKFFDMDEVRKKMSLAGWRNIGAPTTYMVGHILCPVFLLLISIDMTYGPAKFGHSPLKKILIIIGMTAFGMYMPSVLVKNKIQKRQALLKKQFPDALDILLISVESGLTVDTAFQRIGREMGDILPEVSEEFSITSAELAYLGDKTQAYRNLETRTGLSEFREMSTTLIQSEVQGTQVGPALRAMANRSREKRKMEIEKKAGSIGTKMTIPMIAFIMPPMFAMIIGPAIIQVFAMFTHK